MIELDQPRLSDDLPAYLRAGQVLVEERLERFLQNECGGPAVLIEAMRYSLLAPGKRLRPLLVLLANEAGGGQEISALPAACAVEMVHTYSLIHDDLPAMDDDDLRRGQPTCHKKFGEALAILAGDALLTLAFQVLAENYPPATAAVCCRELARSAGAAGMVGGQVEDLAGEGERPVSTGRLSEGEPVSTGRLEGERPVSTGRLTPAARRVEALEHIHAHKTGALFRACLRLGIYTAQGENPGGPDPMLLKSLDDFGRCFGLVFQITDDLLDVEGTAADTGKSVHKDAARGKLTYPGQLGVAESRRRAQLLAEEAVGHLRPLADRGRRLATLLQLVLQRDR